MGLFPQKIRNCMWEIGIGGWERSNCREWEFVCGTDPTENEKLHVRKYNRGVGNQYLLTVGVGLCD